jgi:hypothetical protein
VSCAVRVSRSLVVVYGSACSRHPLTPSTPLSLLLLLRVLSDMIKEFKVFWDAFA